MLCSTSTCQLPQITTLLSLLHYITQTKGNGNHPPHTSYILPLTTKINHAKEVALENATKTHWYLCYKVYCDGSSHDRGIGAAAILYKNNHIVKTCRFHIGTSEEHTVYEVELVSILLALNLLTNLSCQLTNTTLIGLNNQAVIHVLSNQSPKLSHHLLDHIHSAVEKLHQKQDKLQNTTDFHDASREGCSLTARTCGVIDLWIQWVTGHTDFPPNEKADEHTKRAAIGNASHAKKPPKATQDISIAFTCQLLKTKIQNRWAHQWKASPQYSKTWLIEKKLHLWKLAKTCFPPITSSGITNTTVENRPHRSQ